MDLELIATEPLLPSAIQESELPLNFPDEVETVPAINESVEIDPVFNSPTIQNAFDRIKPLIDRSMSSADRIRNDLRSLEKYLQRKQISLHYVHKTKQWTTVLLDEGHYGIAIEGLAWAQCQGQQHRLFYVLNTIYVDDDNANYSLKTDLSKAAPLPKAEDIDLSEMNAFWIKPILESSFVIRERMYPHLGSFLQGLGNKLDELFGEPLPF